MLDDQGLDLIFRNARSQNGFTSDPVPDSKLRELYDIVKWAPTTMNIQPMRIVFIKSEEGKKRLEPALSPGNHDKTMAAPVCTILAWDTQFYENLPKMFPSRVTKAGLTICEIQLAKGEKSVIN